jgi:short-subunit dehydrogenase
MPGTRLSLLGRDDARTAEIARLCREAGAEVDAVIGDVTDAPFMTGWLMRCDLERSVDIVIANAGLGGEAAIAGPAGETMSAAAAIVATNIGGVLNTVLPLLPRFVERRRGHVVLMGSLAGLVALPRTPLYSASKAALRSYGTGLRRLLAPRGVSVTLVSAGYVDTPMSRSLHTRRPFLWDADRAARKIAAGIALRRREIAFPWTLWLAARLGSALPSAILDRMLVRPLRRPPG